MNKFDYYDLKWQIDLCETRLKKIEIMKEPISFFSTKKQKEENKQLELEQEEILSNLQLLYTQFNNLCEVPKKE